MFTLFVLWAIAIMVRIAIMRLIFFLIVLPVIAYHTPKGKQLFFKLGFRLFGIVLERIGKQKDEVHLQWLGHYLAGTGSTMTLSEKALQQLRDDYCNKSLSEEGTLNPRWFDITVGNGNGKYNLWQTLGKVRHTIIGDTLVIIDYYQFYPIGSDCGTRGWYDSKKESAVYSSSSTSLSFEILQKIFGPNTYYPRVYSSVFKFLMEKLDGQWQQLHHEFKSDLFESWKQAQSHGNYLLKLSHYENNTNVSVDFSDAFFEPLGKPFLTHGRIKIDDKQSLAEIHRQRRAFGLSYDETMIAYEKESFGDFIDEDFEDIEEEAEEADEFIGDSEFNSETSYMEYPVSDGNDIALILKKLTEDGNAYELIGKYTNIAEYVTYTALHKHQLVFLYQTDSIDPDIAFVARDFYTANKLYHYWLNSE